MFGQRFGRMFDVLPEMQRLQREVNRLFTGFGQPYSPEFPALNVWMSKDGAIVSAELPGIDPGKVDISVVADTLTLSGVREKDALKEGETYHRQERSFGNFTRTMQIPFHVDAGKVEAKYEKGVLRITLPRSEEDRPKKIPIQSA